MVSIKNIVGTAVALAVLFPFLSVQARETVASTVPVGFVTLDVVPGTGSTKRVTLLAPPLLGVDARIPSLGRVTEVKSATELEVQMVGEVLPEGSISQREEPFVLQITSGSAEGLAFLVSTEIPNTSSRIHLVDPSDPNLNLAGAGIASGDTFRLLVCDTLQSLFGSPGESGVIGASNPKDADTVTIVSNGSAQTYYYNTSLGRWTRVGLGSPDASHVPLLPYYGLQYNRIGSSPLRLLAVGEVPYGKRKVKVKKSGATLLAGYWPLPMTLQGAGLQNMQGWQASNSTHLADRITLSADGSTSTYAHNGQNWRRVSLGNPLSDDVVVGAGSTLFLSRPGQQTGFDTLEQNAPYGGY
jgi:hypothetical protein